MISEKYKEKATKKGKSHWLNRQSDVNSLINNLKKHFKDLSELKILDAGCAQGRDSYEISTFVKKVIGIDSNKPFIKEAKKKCPKIQFKIDNIEKLSFKDNLFDAVYCVNTLFYTNPEKSLVELERVLKKGGLMFITLDKKILDLEKKKQIHSLNIKEALNLLKNSRVVSKKYKTRIDDIPFKHKHFFYEIVLIKNK